MPVDLHQRLSEFSYGYGVVREVELCLEGVGLQSTPFLPSLLHEAELGFDVAFDRPGVPLLLQFKLGEELQRFRRSSASGTIPDLDKPFWRFHVDTAEPNGQFDLLLKAEQADAEALYIAPRFSNWDQYVSAFQNEEVLEHSLLIRPSEIESRLAVQGEPDGSHRIVYDQSRVYICSSPVEAEEVGVEDFGEAFRGRVLERGEPIISALKRTFESFRRSRDIRVAPQQESALEDLGLPTMIAHGRPPQSLAELAQERIHRLEQYRSIASTDADAVFAAVGIETWAIGTQLLAVTLE